ncbi:DUF2637 domain-containing protein [Sinomonas gamaensis]|uniref:DUF2637 domain-containing protein n=1 Tax=Sinomonas gamaensis TaxID=2565624 RepID=UPI001109310B|nr:DUF2637 domain-containing protein [Sinomonas gamaensis]
MAASRVEADSRGVALTALGLVGVLAAASFTLSFQGLIQAAGWAGIPPILRWLVPVVVDSTILVYAVAAAVQRARGEDTRLSWVAVAFFTTVSVAANAAHVLAPDGVPAMMTPAVAFGAGIAAIMPLSLFFATETCVALVVAPPVGSVAQRRKRAFAKLMMERGVNQNGPEGWAASGPLGRTTGGPSGRSAGPQGGPPHGPGGGPRRTKAEIEAEVRRLNEQDGLSQREIARRLGISKTTVARTLGTADKHVPATA